MNVSPNTIQLLEENRGGNLLDTGLDDGILDLTPKVKINKWNYIKLKKLLHSKENQQNEKATY